MLRLVEGMPPGQHTPQPVNRDPVAPLEAHRGQSPLPTLSLMTDSTLTHNDHIILNFNRFKHVWQHSETLGELMTVSVIQILLILLF